MIFVFFFANASFTAVSADKLAAAAEFIDGKAAVVGASPAVCHGSAVFQNIDLVNREHGGLFAFFISFTGNQRCAKSSHDAGNIRTDRLAVRYFFKASQNSVIIEGPSLDNNMFSKLRSI